MLDELLREGGPFQFYPIFKYIIEYEIDVLNDEIQEKLSKLTVGAVKCKGDANIFFKVSPIF